jgi:hypothetical protein
MGREPAEAQKSSVVTYYPKWQAGERPPREAHTGATLKEVPS